MKKGLLAVLIFAGLLSSALSVSWADRWFEEKTTHFVIYYRGAKDSFLYKLIEKAEDYYDRIADDLGFRRFDFWLWDNRAKIYIYDTAEEYQQETRQPAWSAGCASPAAKTITTYSNAQGFFDSVLPHEMSHIIFREFVGFDNPAVPVWLEEGVASYQQIKRDSGIKMRLKTALADGTFIPLESLKNMSPAMMMNTAMVELFYLEASGAVDFLINEYGKDNFVLFCQQLRDKRVFERALTYAYPLRDIKDLDDAWQHYINE